MRQHQADAVGPEDAQQLGPGGIEHCCLALSASSPAVMTTHGAAADARRLADEPGHGRSRRRDDGEVGRDFGVHPPRLA